MGRAIYAWVYDYEDEIKNLLKMRSEEPRVSVKKFCKKDTSHVVEGFTTINLFDKIITIEISKFLRANDYNSVTEFHKDIELYKMRIEEKLRKARKIVLEELEKGYDIEFIKKPLTEMLFKQLDPNNEYYIQLEIVNIVQEILWIIQRAIDKIEKEYRKELDDKTQRILELNTKISTLNYEKSECEDQLEKKKELIRKLRRIERQYRKLKKALKLAKQL